MFYHEYSVFFSVKSTFILKEFEHIKRLGKIIPESFVSVPFSFI